MTDQITGVPIDAKTTPTVAPDVKSERAAEQATIKDLAAVVKDKGNDYFAQQEAFAKAFEEKEGEDSLRRAARIEQERLRIANAGNPMHDAVAKQQAMDMNTVEPGAVADAKKITDVGAAAAKK